MSSIVAQWFGAQFAQLHPKLQQLHLAGGRLAGEVDIGFGTGMAGWLGRRLAGGLGLPVRAGRCPFAVDISQAEGQLVWARQFDIGGSPPRTMVSVFEPMGAWPDGYWLERSGAMRFKLTVDVRDGGWYWRVLGVRWHGIPLPVALLPAAHAYKRVEEGGYRFEVMFAAPLLGPLVWYRGLLVIASK